MVAVCFSEMSVPSSQPPVSEPKTVLRIFIIREVQILYSFIRLFDELSTRKKGITEITEAINPFVTVNSLVTILGRTLHLAVCAKRVPKMSPASSIQLRRQTNLRIGVTTSYSGQFHFCLFCSNIIPAFLQGKGNGKVGSVKDVKIYGGTELLSCKN